VRAAPVPSQPSPSVHLEADYRSPTGATLRKGIWDVPVIRGCTYDEEGTHARLLP
jgi:hypothetical protein